MTNYKLYQSYIKTIARSERRRLWLGDSPVYVDRLRLIKELANERLKTFNYVDKLDKHLLIKIISER